MQVMTNRAEYLKVLEQMAPLAQKVQGDAMSTRVQALSTGVRSGELLIPVVGGFSAGKSTLLNTLLGRNLLPTAIRPETALATELHYGEIERIEAFNSQQLVRTFELNQFEEINQNAAQYTHLKIYLNCSLLRDLEPAVLVDMPGFESPLDLHNTAINYYLDKGCLYIALINCQDGTVTSSLLRQLEKIDGYGCPFHVFITKTDLRPQNEVDSVRAEIEGQLEVYFLGREIKVGTVNNKSAAQVQELLNNIDCNQLFRNKYLPGLQQLGEALSSDLKLQADMLEQQEQEKLEQAVRSMEAAVAELKRKQLSLSDNLEAQFNLSQIQQDVIKRVESDLHANRDQVVTQALGGNLDLAQATFIDVVHNAVVNALNGKLEEIDQKIFSQYQEAMGSISQELQRNCFSSVDFGAQITQLVRTDFNLSQVVTQEPGANLGMASNISTLVLQGLNILSTAAGPLKLVVAGVISVLNSILPGLLSNAFSKMREEKIRAKVNEMVDNIFIPQVLTHLRPQMSKLLSQEISNKLEVVSKSFTKAVDEKRSEMNQIIEQNKNTYVERQAQAAALKQAAEQVDMLMRSLA